MKLMEIFISVERVSDNDFNVSFDEELLMSVHGGMLHYCG
jgi:hypothetical protein